jgi:hypothetical protein
LLLDGVVAEASSASGGTAAVAVIGGGNDDASSCLVTPAPVPGLGPTGATAGASAEIIVRYPSFGVWYRSARRSWAIVEIRPIAKDMWRRW